MIFLLTSMFVGVIAVIAGQQFIDEGVVLKNLLLSLYFCFSCFYFTQRFENFGIGMLASIVLLILISFFNLYIFFIAIFFLAIVCLENTYSIGIPMGRLRLFFLGGAKDYPGKATEKWNVAYLIIIPLAAIIFAAISFSATNRGYANFLIDQEILYGIVHIDTVWHSTWASIINNYEQVSTALHGLPDLRYHVFSHFLYGRISQLLNIPVTQVFGYTNFMVFIPLLLTSILFLSEQLSPSNRPWKFAISVLLLASVFIGFIGPENFSKLGVWNSYFASESYCIALILFMAFLAFILREERSENLFIYFFVALLFILMMGISKLSLGVMGAVCFTTKEIFFSKLRFVFKGLIVILSGVISLMFLAIYQAQTGESNDLLHFFTRFSETENPFRMIGFFNFFNSFSENPFHLTRFWHFISFLLFHYFFSWLALVIMLIYYFKNRSEFMKFKVLFGLLMIITFLSYAPLMLKIDSAYYFSNVPMFAALPIYLSIKNHLSFKRLRLEVLVFALIVLWAVYGDVKYGKNYLLDSYNSYRERVIAMEDRVSEGVGISGYIEQFKGIERDKSTKKYLVYVPKTETKFWDSSYARKGKISHTDKATIAPFLIPSVSGRPALFGFPKFSWEALLRSSRWYKHYNHRDYLESQKLEIDQETLCSETLSLGFKGYIVVRENLQKKVNCIINN